MILIGLSLPKRLLLYFSFGILWGLGFTYLYLRVMNSDYLFFGFLLDSTMLSSIGILVGLIVEIYRIIVIRKAQKIKYEISQTNTVLIDGPTYYLAERPKVFEGWLFLTEENLLFKTLGKKKKRDIILPIESIQISKYRLVFNIKINSITYFQVNRKWFDLINSRLNPSKNQ